MDRVMTGRSRYPVRAGGTYRCRGRSASAGMADSLADEDEGVGQMTVPR